MKTAKSWMYLLSLLALALAWTPDARAASAPQKSLDECTGGICSIYVKGWAFDPDASSQSIDVHVYLYTDSGCTSQYGDVRVLTTNVSRSDVNQAYNITGDHGFEANLLVNDARTYWVKVFAIDATGDSNSQIGSTKSVTVTNIDWNYTVSNGKATLTNPAVPTGTTGAIGIPSTLGGYPVTSIGYEAFYDCTNLTIVMIPDSVTSIGEAAFADCRGLTSVTIPDSVTSIGDLAFYFCTSLTSVTIPDSVTSIGEGAFDYCSRLTSVTIPDSVTSIGDYTFYCCSRLASVTIPNSVTNIGDNAFSGCSRLASVTIPNSVTNIGTSAFSSCGNIRSVVIPGRFRLSEVLPSSYSAITNAVVATGSTSIASSAFSNCRGLTSVTIPDSVTSIGASAFSGCTSLAYDTSTIPNVKLVDGWAVGYESALSGSLDLSGVRGIADGAFTGCGNIRSVVIPGRFRLSEVFPASYSAITNAVVTSGSTDIGDGAFSGCGGLASITIPDSVTSIGVSAFSGCSGLASVTIPDAVTTIGDTAFAGCRGLTSVTIPDSVVDLPVSAFNGCTRLWASTFRNDGGPQTVSLTVTNVVVHFVTQSVPSAAVTPATNATGIVNIIAEVTASNAVAIAQDWAAQYPGFEAAYGSDFTAALTMETGKRDGAGRPLRVWQDYVAGTDPTDSASLFAASIVHDAQTGDMIVSCSPELAPAEAAKRRYSVYGKANLADPGWTLLGTGLPWRASENSVFHFFRVTVEMR